MAINKDNSIFYVHNDHLNTPRKVTNTNNVVVFDWPAVDPFGANQPTINTIGFNIRYPGQYYDTETAYHYNYHRYYNPKTGKYLQADPIGLDGGYNLYNYVDNNSLIGVDPEGLLVLFLGNKNVDKYMYQAYLNAKNNHDPNKLIIFGHGRFDAIVVSPENESGTKIPKELKINEPTNTYYLKTPQQLIDLLNYNDIKISDYTEVEFRVCDLAIKNFASDIAKYIKKPVLAADDYYYFGEGGISIGPKKTIRLSDKLILKSPFVRDMIYITSE